MTPVMIKSAKGRKIIDRVAMERVLTGTDGPYLKAGDRLTNHSMYLVQSIGGNLGRFSGTR